MTEALSEAVERVRARLVERARILATEPAEPDCHDRPDCRCGFCEQDLDAGALLAENSALRDEVNKNARKLDEYIQMWREAEARVAELEKLIVSGYEAIDYIDDLVSPADWEAFELAAKRIRSKEG